MIKYIFVVLLMMVVFAASLQAQLLQRNRLKRPQHKMDSTELLASATNEAERAQIEQRIKNGELPEPIVPIEEALALAEKGDGKGYYQLAVRYVKGDGVRPDRKKAAKLLAKAYDANYPRAVFAAAIEIECAMGKYAKEEDEPSYGVRFGCDRKVLMQTLGMDTSQLRILGHEIENGITNEIHIAKVRGEYKRAMNFGIGAAEEELSRFEKRVALAKARIKIDRKNEDAVSELLGKKETGGELKVQDAEEFARFDNRVVLSKKEDRELWISWPTRISDEEQMDIRAQAERKFNCVLMLGDRSSTNSWRVGRGASCILSQDSQYGWDVLQKIDASGKIVGISRSDATDYETFEELKWLSDQENGRIVERQEKWAKEHGMTLDEAKTKYEKWEETLRRRPLLGGLRRSRRQREQERAEQRQQLLATLEELKGVRETKAAAAQKEAR